VLHDPTTEVDEHDNLKGALGRRRFKEHCKRQFEEAHYLLMKGQVPIM
jgi:hypothetical protein